MPQGLGKNLYPDLSIRENIEFFGRLFGQFRSEREERIAVLLESTSSKLDWFTVLEYLVFGLARREG